jgi:hypothetical protein
MTERGSLPQDALAEREVGFSGVGRTSPKNRDMGQRPSHTTPSADEIAQVRKLVEQVGAEGAQRILGLGRHTVDRIQGGLTVHRGTLAQLRNVLEQQTQVQP